MYVYMRIDGEPIGEATATVNTHYAFERIVHTHGHAGAVPIMDM